MLLAVDTSTRYLGVALYDGVSVLSELTWLSQNHHTVELSPAVAAALKQADMDSTALVAVAVALGPGSFTGLRIGLAFAKGLALSCRIPILGIPTLDILAAAQPVTNVLLASVLEAGRKRLAVAWYQVGGGRWNSTGELDNLTIEEFVDKLQPPMTVCGELSEVLREKIAAKHEDIVLASPAHAIRRPSFLAELAWNRWQNGDSDNPATLKPLYLHHGDPIPG
jgi:tRNA threonylcarbamoyladenosine biosynthesis protein TsaB